MRKEVKAHNTIYILIAITFASVLRAITYSAHPAGTDGLAAYIICATAGVACVALIYLIGLKLSKNSVCALFAAMLAAAVPLFGWRIYNNHIHTLELFLLFCIIYIVLCLKRVSWVIPLLLTIPFAFLHVYSLALIPVILLYVFMLKLQGLHMSKPEVRFCVFSTIAIILIFAFFAATPALILIVSQYVTNNYYAMSVANFKLTTAFAIAGALPIYLGLFGAYEGVIRRNKGALLLLSVAAVYFIASIINMINFRLALPYIVLSLAALSSLLYKNISYIISESIAKRYAPIIHSCVIIAIAALGTIHWLATV